MSRKPPETASDARISELEQQLADATRAEEAHHRGDAELALALEYARNIVDTVREPLLVLDGTLHIVTASRSFYGAFDLTREQTEGSLIYDLLDRQWDIPALRTLLEEVLTKDQEFHDFEMIHSFTLLGPRVMLLNGRKVWTQAGNSNLILLAIEDITDRKRIAEELVRSNEDLQRFAYVAAHDLRSPVNAALNLCQLLALRVEAKFDAQEHQMLRLSIESLERLSTLMSDLLTYSEMGNVPSQHLVISLADPLRIALANLQHHIEATGAIISVGELPSIKTDRTQMAMLLQNLIGNALKYRREEPLRIHIESTRVGKHFRVSIADNGQGFPPEHASCIFEPFKRLHGSSIRGSGIGLATCKRIVERWGGRIWAESIPGQGSTFFFTVPQELSGLHNPNEASF